MITKSIENIFIINNMNTILTDNTKLTRFLVIGDPHFKTDNIKDTNDMCNSVYEILNTEKVDFIVVLGDILHRHETIHVSPLHRSMIFLRNLSKYTKTFVLI